jgi:hypothetical protein
LRVDPPRGVLLPRLLPVYQYHMVTGDIRNGNSRTLLTDLSDDAAVFVRVQLDDGRRPRVQKKLLVAISAHGWPPHSECPACGERIPYMSAQLNGLITDTSPANLKWVPDVDAEVRHRALCVEELVREDPFKPYRRRHSICFIADELSDHEIYEIKAL